MLRPASDEAHIFARRDLPEVAHSGVRGRELGTLVGAQPDDRKPPVITPEKHVLDQPFKDFF
jgi:hypothetical protein